MLKIFIVFFIVAFLIYSMTLMQASARKVTIN